MITVRLDKDLEKSIESVTKAIGITKSDFIRRSIQSFMKNYKNNNAWLLGQDLFGKYGSDNSRLSIDSEKILKNKIKSKLAK